MRSCSVLLVLSASPQRLAMFPDDLEIQMPCGPQSGGCGIHYAAPAASAASWTRTEPPAQYWGRNAAPDGPQCARPLWTGQCCTVPQLPPAKGRSWLRWHWTALHMQRSGKRGTGAGARKGLRYKNATSVVASMYNRGCSVGNPQCEGQGGGRDEGCNVREGQCEALSQNAALIGELGNGDQRGAAHSPSMPRPITGWARRKRRRQMVWSGFCEGHCRHGGRSLWGVHISCCGCIVGEYHAHWLDSLPVPFSLAWTNLRQHSDYDRMLVSGGHPAAQYSVLHLPGKLKTGRTPGSTNRHTYSAFMASPPGKHARGSDFRSHGTLHQHH